MSDFDGYIESLTRRLDELSREASDMEDQEALRVKGESLKLGKQSNSVVPSTTYEDLLGYDPRSFPLPSGKTQADVDADIELVQAFTRFVGYVDSGIEESI